LYAELFPASPEPATSVPPRPNDLSDEEIVEKAHAAKNGEKFARLWAGDTSDYGGDDSAADLALHMHLAFYTGGDHVRMDRLFRKSGLMRPKWERPDYSERTIAKARELTTSYCSGGTATPARPALPGASDPPISARELLAKVFPEQRWILPGIIPVGLTLFFGPYKIGKSLWALELAISVATGSRAFGNLEVEQGRVLYLALEDGERRLQRRIRELGFTAETVPPDLMCKPVMATIARGGLEWLDNWLTENPAKLVIIDVLARIRDQRPKNTEIYLADYQMIADIKALADKHDCGIILVHHPRKGAAEDKFDRASGSTGLGAAADANLYLERPGRKEQGTLHVTGRDVEDQELAFTFRDRRWTYQGEAGRSLTPEQEAILEVLVVAGEPLTPAQITSRLEGVPSTTVKSRLSKLVERELLANDNGRYRLLRPWSSYHGEAPLPFDTIERLPPRERDRSSPSSGASSSSASSGSSMDGSIRRVDFRETNPDDVGVRPGKRPSPRGSSSPDEPDDMDKPIVLNAEFMTAWEGEEVEL
jgi:hypothetical protein